MTESIRTFRAANVADALAQIRREMGLNAVVIDTREVTRNSLLPWVSPRREVEVTAKRPSTRPSRQSGDSNSVKSTVQNHVQGKNETIASTSQLQRYPLKTASLAGDQQQATSPSLHDVNTKLNKDATLLPASQSSSPHAITPNTSRTVAADSVKLLPNSEETSTENVNSINSIPNSASPETGKSSSTSRFFDPMDLETIESRLSKLTDNDILACQTNVPPASKSNENLSSNRGNSSQVLQQPQTVKLTTDASVDLIQSLENRLEVLQGMIEQLSRRTTPAGLAQIPSELFPYYLTLIEAEVDDQYARDIILKLKRHANSTQHDDTCSLTSLLTALLEREIPCEATTPVHCANRKVTMLLGPTGVGKTTTLAKFAGRLAITDGLRVALITVDTYRVAAVEQLKMYADIINLPMKVVSSPSEMSAAMESFHDFDAILIDTPGCNPFNSRQLHDLKNLVDAARPDQVHLVMSMAAGTKAIRTAAEQFRVVQPTSLIISKLDEAAGCGGLVSIGREISLPIAYITTGQEVPRDIEPATAMRLARMILKKENLKEQIVNGSDACRLPEVQPDNPIKVEHANPDLKSVLTNTDSCSSQEITLTSPEYAV